MKLHALLKVNLPSDYMARINIEERSYMLSLHVLLDIAILRGSLEHTLNLVKILLRQTEPDKVGQTLFILFLVHTHVHTHTCVCVCVCVFYYPSDLQILSTSMQSPFC